MNINYAKKSAFAGVITALCIALMFSSAILPLLSYTLPALCGIILMVTSLTVGEKYAYISYVATSLLSLFLVADKECMLLFIAFFGYYPILKSRLDLIKNKFIMLITKFAIFNVSIISTQYILIKVFGIMLFEEEFLGKWAIVIMIAFINIFFFIFDKVLYQFERIYNIKWKKTLKKLLK